MSRTGAGERRSASLHFPHHKFDLSRQLSIGSPKWSGRHKMPLRQGHPCQLATPPLRTFASRGMERPLRSATTRINQMRTARFMSATSASKGISWGKIAWRCVWVPYAVLSMIPNSFLVLTLYHFLKGDHAKARGWAFYAVTGYVCLPLSVVVNFAAPFVYLTDWDRRVFYNYMTKLWGKLTTYPFLVPTIKGADRIPREGPVVFVSNHQSWLDIFCLCWLPDDVLLRFISKKQIAYIPVVGWSMALLGHVLFDRKTGGKQLLEDCSVLLQKGIPIFFFPEGTRSRDLNKTLPFKIGAFKLALDAKATLVPITIAGTGSIMRVGHETELELDGTRRDAGISIVVHAPIVVHEGDTVESLRDRSAALIQSGLDVAIDASS